MTHHPHQGTEQISLLLRPAVLSFCAAIVDDTELILRLLHIAYNNPTNQSINQPIVFIDMK